MAMELWYPNATRKPLGRQTEPYIGRPRIFVVHTMVGFLRGTDALFRRQGYQGVESHFGLGGPLDGPGFDGVIWQWQSLDREADAQSNGNAYSTSIETSDGGHPLNPWSRLQQTALIDLMVWWARQTGNPIRLVKSPHDTGIGYHAQFTLWNPNKHSCPAPVRIKQLVTDVIPRAAAILAGGVLTSPTRGILKRYLYFKRGRDMMHGPDVVLVQVASHTKPDGWFGPKTDTAVRNFQKRKNLLVDGIVGPRTAKAMNLLWEG